MTFAAPLFLLAAIAAAIPIVLHMINRQKVKELPFPTLRFLKVSVQKTRRRKRIHDVLLMLVRASVLLLIAAGLARPAVTNLSSLWHGTQAAVVVILDNSASMGMIDQDRVRFDTATSAVSQIFDELTDGDQVALLATCGPVLPNAHKLDRTQDTARQVLTQCRLSYERANLGLKIRQARELLEKSDAPSKQIYVLSDMQKVSWEAVGEAKKGDRRVEGEERMVAPAADKTPTTPESNVAFIVVDCNRTPKPDVAVQCVAVEAAVPVAGLPVKAIVTLLNASAISLQPRVELWIDGEKESSSPEVRIPPGERAKHEFLLKFKHGGLHRGEVRLVGEDGSKYDDRRFFAMDVDQEIPVAVVRGKRHEIPYLDDAYYLDQALSPDGGGGWAIRTTSLVADDLLSEPLDRYKAVFCVNLPALGADAAERLRAYIAAGGNIFWICGDNVVPEAYNQMNRDADDQLLPAPLIDVRSPTAGDGRNSWHISFLDKEYPAMRPLCEPASLYESVLVHKHARMAAGDGVQVLARLDDGEPLLVLRKIGKGRALMFGATLHVNWSNLPLRPIFLPMMARLTFGLAETERRSYSAIAGQPLVLQFPDQPQPIGVELIPPSGETLRLKTEAAGGAVGQTFRYPNTYDIGIYLLRMLNTMRASQVTYAINYDPDEADPATLEREALKERLGPAPLVFAENPDDLSSTFALLREGKSLWSFFLTAVIVALVLETLVSNRLGPKREEQSGEEPPPGMRRLAKKG
jgi:hypothetical protein